jgi:hypothetical protein
MVTPDYMDQARSLASGAREPYIAWSHLKQWAIGKGPSGMKAAMVSFLEQHGSRPEAAAVIPEIIKSASMMPPSERQAIMESANMHYSSMARFGQMRIPSQKMKLPMSGNRPQFISVFKPKAMQSNPALGMSERFSQEALDPRDSIFRASENLKFVPQRATKISRESFAPAMVAAPKNAMMDSLIGRIRSHGQGQMISFGSTEVGLAKKKRKVKRAKKVKARIKARTPSRLKSRVKPRAKGRTAKRRK